MGAWADYLISAVSYNPNREIIEVEVYEDLGDKVSFPQLVDKLTITHNIRQGKKYITIYKTLNNWRRGDPVYLHIVGGSPWLRIDDNKTALDNLGMLPSINYDERAQTLAALQEQIKIKKKL